jgi:hypothetical protein
VGVLRDIINQFDLVDEWRTRHPDTRQCTWVKVFGARVILHVQESEQQAVGHYHSPGGFFGSPLNHGSAVYFTRALACILWEV